MAEEKYVIEGTVTEISREATKNIFKISGTEGYSLRKKDGKEYVKENVLCRCTINKENKIVEDNKAPSYALKIPDDFAFNVSDNYISLFISSLSDGKKMRIVFEEATTLNENETNIATDETKVLDKVLKIISVSILAN